MTTPKVATITSTAYQGVLNKKLSVYAERVVDREILNSMFDIDRHRFETRVENLIFRIEGFYENIPINTAQVFASVALIEQKIPECINGQIIKYLLSKVFDMFKKPINHVVVRDALEILKVIPKLAHL